jgi:cytochrome P450
MQADRTTNIPAHVPPELVKSFPLHLGATTYENPFDRIVPEIHEGPPVFYAPDGWQGLEAAWVFRRAEDLRRIYMDTEHFSSKDFAPFATLVGQDWNVLPVEADPPRHRLYRTVMNPFFSNNRVVELNDQVRQRARDYIGQFRNRGQCEFVGDFAARFPIAVFLELFGLPLEDVDQFLAWEEDLLHNPDVDDKTAAVLAVKGYIDRVAEARREHPRGDLISDIVHAEVDGYRFSDDEIFGLCFNLYLGGLDTVTTNLSWQFRHLATHPDDQARLRAEPALMPDAIEELMRAYAAVTTGRTCIKPVSVGGVELEPGDRVMMSTTLGNTDPEAFENPFAVRFDRKPRHLAFGTGIHACVGARLARRELHLAMEEIFAAIPPFRLAPDAKIRSNLGGVMNIDNLPLIWDS